MPKKVVACILYCLKQCKQLLAADGVLLSNFKWKRNNLLILQMLPLLLLSICINKSATKCVRYEICAKLFDCKFHRNQTSSLKSDFAIDCYPNNG